MNTRLRRIVIAAAALAAVAAIGLALIPAGVPVETGVVSRGRLFATADGSGRVRVRDRFIVAAPVSGHLERIALRAGDGVEPGSAVARISPATPFPLDARTRAEAEARLIAASAAQGEAGNAVELAKSARDHARREHARLKTLVEGRAVAPRDLDAAEYEATARERAVRSAELAVRSAAGNAAAARAALTRFARRADAGELVAVTAPESGERLTVLRVLAEHEGPVAAGTPLVELGAPARLEAVTDLLTTDAVRVRLGDRATIEGWGGGEPLGGRVRLVEPSAFTKISALGVEEQRVLVVIDPDGGPWDRLSDGWRIEARITVWERPAALRIPSAALFREGDGWTAFAVRGGKAVRTRVGIGERGPRESEILSGLAEGDAVILYPGDKLRDGVRVDAR